MHPGVDLEMDLYLDMLLIRGLLNAFDGRQISDRQFESKPDCIAVLASMRWTQHENGRGDAFFAQLACFSNRRDRHADCAGTHCRFRDHRGAVTVAVTFDDGYDAGPGTQ